MSSDFIKNPQTMSGKFIKYIGPYHSACLFELTENVILEIDLESKGVSFLMKNKNEEYRSVFDIFAESDSVDRLKLEIISPAIEQILVGKDRSPIANPLSAIDVIDFELSQDQMEIWGKKFRK